MCFWIAIRWLFCHQGIGNQQRFIYCQNFCNEEMLFENRNCDHPIVVVVSPLNSLMDNQLSVLHASGITAVRPHKKIGTLSVHVSAHGDCTVAKGFNQYSVACKNFKGLMFNS